MQIITRGFLPLFLSWFFVFFFDSLRTQTGSRRGNSIRTKSLHRLFCPFLPLSSSYHPSFSNLESGLLSESRILLKLGSPNHVDQLSHIMRYIVDLPNKRNDKNLRFRAFRLRLNVSAWDDQQFSSISSLFHLLLTPSNLSLISSFFSCKPAHFLSRSRARKPSALKFQIRAIHWVLPTLSPIEMWNQSRICRGKRPLYR